MDGISLIQLERFAEAERALRRALVWAEQVSNETLFDRRSWRTFLCGYSRQQLAFAVLRQRRWPAAEEYARQAIAELECASGSTTEQARAWLYLAAALDEQQRLTESVEALQYGQQTLLAENAGNPEDADFASLRQVFQQAIEELRQKQAAEGKVD
jgi:tetratricopeptide (TPR) repeat protein